MACEASTVLIAVLTGGALAGSPVAMRAIRRRYDSRRKGPGKK